MNSSNTSLEIKEEIFITRFQFFVWGVIALPIAIFGVFGNVLSICVLRNKRMRTSTSVYLVSLAVADIFVLITFIIIFSLPVLAPQVEPSLKTTYTVFYPISLTAHTLTVYITVAFTTERYVAIRYPMKASRWCTRKKARKILIWIFVLSIIYNIPRMIEHIHFPINVDSSPSQINITDTNLTVKYWLLRNDPQFTHVYHMYMYSIMMFVIPFITLSVFNCLLLKTVRNSKMATKSNTVVIGRYKRRDSNLTVMLISVVVVFLICQILPMFDNLLNAFWPAHITKTEKYNTFFTISTFMVVINSAVNFVMYCCFGKKFRLTLLWMINPRLVANPNNAFSRTNQADRQNCHTDACDRNCNYNSVENDDADVECRHELLYNVTAV